MKVRVALDDRDGYTERKRETAYNLLWQLGAHPTYAGFQMLQSKDPNLINVGPFFDAKLLGIVLYELAKTRVANSSTPAPCRAAVLIFWYPGRPGLERLIRIGMAGGPGIARCPQRFPQRRRFLFYHPNRRIDQDCRASRRESTADPGRQARSLTWPAPSES